MLAGDLFVEQNSIDGVAIRELTPIGDKRGNLCEIHRDGWELAPRPVQWDFITSAANVLRGVHVHQLRFDYFVVLAGRATIGLTDARRHAPSFRQSMTIDVSSERPCVVTVPPGVAHGIYAHGALSYLYGLTNAWDGRDEELGFRYDDPAEGLIWPSRNPVILDRDADLPDFEAFVREFERAGGVRI
jgi:dTDP-4-dehydrorhamnose 3,5-epimerase